MNKIKSPLKWAGGKAKIADQIIDLMPDFFDRYFEPFLGGGSVALRVLESPRFEGKTFYLSDHNPELVNCFECINLDPVAVRRGIESLSPPGGWDKDAYYRLRGFDRPGNPVCLSRYQKAARFILLNKLGFNGLCRYNKFGEFNVPYGYYKKPGFPTVDELHKVSQLLRKSSIREDDFAKVISEAKVGDFVYLDPPYVPIVKNGFTGYSGSWNIESQERLLESLRIADRRGVKWLLSGHDEPIYRGWYSEKNFPVINITEINVARSIAANGSRPKVAELLISNY